MMTEQTARQLARELKAPKIKGDCSICASENVFIVPCYHSQCKGPDGEQNSACVTCHQTYIETNSAQQPQCMWGRHPFGRVFIYKHFPQSWIKGGGLSQKRGEHLSQDQAANLPGVQDVASEYKKLYTIYDPAHQRSPEDVASDLKDVIKEILETDRALQKEKLRKKMLEDELSELSKQGETRSRQPSGMDVLSLAKSRLRANVAEAAKDEMVRQRIQEETAIVNRKVAHLVGKRRITVGASSSSSPSPTTPSVIVIDADVSEALEAKEPAEPAEPAERVVCNCPKDGCSGFVMITKNKRSGVAQCRMCETDVCVKCQMRVHDDDDHECDPGVLATLREIREQARPCPWEGCGILTIKSSGCDQMWCTSCKRAWYWSNGRKHETAGGIHNPYYFQHIRTDPAALNNNYGFGGYDSDPEPEVDDAACCNNGGAEVVRPMTWGRVLDREMPSNGVDINGRSFKRDNFRTIMININHANDEFQPVAHSYKKTDFRPTIELNNVKRVSGQISQEEWAKELVRIDNKVQYSREIYDIVCGTMVQQTWTTFRDLRRLCMTQPISRPHIESEVKSKIEDLDKLREDLNTELKKIGAEYNRNYPKFDKNFKMTDIKVNGDKKPADRTARRSTHVAAAPATITTPLTEEERERAMRISEKKRMLADD